MNDIKMISFSLKGLFGAIFCDSDSVNLLQFIDRGHSIITIGSQGNCCYNVYVNWIKNH